MDVDGVRTSTTSHTAVSLESVSTLLWNRKFGNVQGASGEHRDGMLNITTYLANANGLLQQPDKAKNDKGNTRDQDAKRPVQNRPQDYPQIRPREN